MNNRVLFVRGPQSSVDNCPFREGQFIMTNEGELYLDLPTVGRCKIQTIPCDIKENDYGKDSIYKAEVQDSDGDKASYDSRYGCDFRDSYLSSAGSESCFDWFRGGEEY